VSRKLTRRGFLAAAGLVPIMPAPPRTAYTTREVTIWKGRSVGATNSVLENLVGFYEAQKREATLERAVGAMARAATVDSSRIEFVFVKEDNN
jgi:hypothetical protein